MATIVALWQLECVVSIWENLNLHRTNAQSAREGNLFLDAQLQLEQNKGGIYGEVEIGNRGESWSD